jgi:uracil-DNA glycosylase
LIIVLGKHTVEIFEKMYDVHVAFGELVSVLLGGKKYMIFSLYHPSPIHPKSMQWNRDIIERNEAALSSLIDNILNIII